MAEILAANAISDNPPLDRWPGIAALTLILAIVLVVPPRPSGPAPTATKTLLEVSSVPRVGACGRGTPVARRRHEQQTASSD